MKHDNNLKKLKKILLKNIAIIISDKKINKIIELIVKNDKKIEFNSKNITIKQYDHKSFSIITKKFITKVFFDYHHYSSELFPILKLNRKNFPHIIKLIDYDEDNHFMIIEKVNKIYECDKINKKYANKRFIKKLIKVIIKGIYSLFIHNSQNNRQFSYQTIGIDKDGIIKIFGWEDSHYLDIENHYVAKEELYKSLQTFIDELIMLLTLSKEDYLRKQVILFFKDFNKTLTDKRIVERPTISGNYKKYMFRAFKFLNFKEIVYFVSEW